MSTSNAVDFVRSPPKCIRDAREDGEAGKARHTSRKIRGPAPKTSQHQLTRDGFRTVAGREEGRAASATWSAVDRMVALLVSVLLRIQYGVYNQKATWQLLNLETKGLLIQRRGALIGNIIIRALWHCRHRSIETVRPHALCAKCCAFSRLHHPALLSGPCASDPGRKCTVRTQAQNTRNSSCHHLARHCRKPRTACENGSLAQYGFQLPRGPERKQKTA